MRTYERIFQNKDKLAKLFSLYDSGKGMSILKLAEYFKVDRTSIRYQLSKKFKLLKRIKPALCPNCEMKLSSPYHIKNPCK